MPIHRYDPVFSFDGIKVIEISLRMGYNCINIQKTVFL